MREKFSSLADAILRGEHPGCREPGFDPKPLFEKEARKIAGEYIAKFDQIDAIKAFCQSVHQAGLETFEDWTTVGVDDKSASVLMALRPALARTPAFKAVLAGILAGENNVFARAVSELERKQQYVGTPLRNMTLEP